MDSSFAPLEAYIQNPQTRQQAEALVEALRGSAGTPAQQGVIGASLGQSAPAMAQAVSATADGSGIAQGSQMGQQLGTLLKPGADNLATAMRYGTTPGSQQTAMLQAQDVGMF